ncbi:MAG: AsmA-like C-terminal region-containing protein [Thermonemataceae bacterium]|nr:AsmA-like C-terminal region-containing protein [Thermonemataceae bacterium]
MKAKKAKKILKVVSRIFLFLTISLIVISFALPHLLKNRIKVIIDENSKKLLNANVHLNKEDLEIDLWNHFPNITISQKNLSVTGKNKFKNDTLFSAKKLSFTVDILPAIFSNELFVKAVYLNEPRIFAKRLSSKEENWDILIAQKESSQNKNRLNIYINHWQIRNGLFAFEDQSTQSFILLENFSHEGKGDLRSSLINIHTQTKIENYIVNLKNTSYFDKRSLDFVVDMQIDKQSNKCTFKDNSFKINDFSFSIVGFFKIIKEKNEIEMDLALEKKEHKLKNLLSLLPIIYEKEFHKIKTEGDFKMQFWAKGILSKERIPTYQISLQVKDGVFQYTDFKQSISNIQIDFKANNKDGIWENTQLNVEKFHLELEKNFIDAKIKIDKIFNGNTFIQLTAKLNLEDLKRVFPLKKVMVKGMLDLDILANGIYNNHQLPIIKSKILIQNAYLKSIYYSKPLEKINLFSTIENNTGKYADTKILLEQMKMELDGEPVEIKATFQNLQDLNYHISAKGSVDLEKLTKIYPIKNTSISGKIVGNIQTSGKMSDFNAKNYEKLPTKGSLLAHNLTYKNAQSLAQGFTINQAKCTFTPQDIILEKCNGRIGKSEWEATGKLTNYLAYFFKKEVLIANLDFKSNHLFIDDLLFKNNHDFSKKTNETIKIPQNIDFTLKPNITKITYQKIHIQSLKSNIALRSGQLQIQNASFATMGGAFMINGFYKPSEEKPNYSFDIDIKNMDIAEAYTLFLDKKSDLKPYVKGNFSCFMKISGNLGQDMLPLYDDSMRGILRVNMPHTHIKNLIFIQKISKLIKLDNLEYFEIKNLQIYTEIKEGFVYYQPFEFLANDYKMSISGKHSLKGDLDFKLRLFIDKSKINTATEVAIALLTKQKLLGVKELIVDFTINGTYKNQIINVLKFNGDTIKVKNKIIREKINEKITKRRADIQEKQKLFRKTPEEIMEEAQIKVDSLLKNAETKAIKIREKAEEEEQKSIETAANKNKIYRKYVEKMAANRKKIEYVKAEQEIKKAQKKADKIMLEAEEIARRMRK